MNQRLAIAIEEGVNGEQIVAEHFGGCTKFNVCELDEFNNVVKYETYINPIAGEHGGVCQLPGYVQQFNISTVIAGGMGRKAADNFVRCGITVITAPGLLYEEALEQFRQGSLHGFEVCQHEHQQHHAH